MQSKKDFEVARQARVRQLWQARAPEERTATGVLIFMDGWRTTTQNCSSAEKGILMSI
jgi:hypothetical protein